MTLNVKQRTAKAFGSTTTRATPARKAAPVEKPAKSQAASGPLRASPGSVDLSSWNGKGVQPSGIHFSDDTKASDFWKAVLKAPALKPFAKLTGKDDRAMFTMRSFERRGDKLDAQIEVYRNGKTVRVNVKDIPASTAFGQLKTQASGAKPVLPFGVGIFATDGGVGNLPSADGKQNPRGLVELADYLGLKRNKMVFTNDPNVYVSAGYHELTGVRVDAIAVDVYGEMKLRYTPFYDRELLQDSKSTYLPLERFLGPGRPKAFDDVLAAIKPTLSAAMRKSIVPAS